MWKQATVVLALAALCSAQMGMQRPDTNLIVDQISGNIYDRMTGAILANIKDMISSNVQEKISGVIVDQISGNIYDKMTSAIIGNIKDMVSGNVQDKVSGVIVDKVSGNIYDKVSGEIVGIVKDMLSEKKEERSPEYSFEELCKCHPGEPEEDFTEAQLTAFINKVGELEEFLEEHPYPEKEGFEAVVWGMKYTDHAFDKFAELMSDNQKALKAAALSCVASGDIEIEKVREALDKDLFEGIEIDFDSEGQWSKEEFMLKILKMKFKVLLNKLKKYRYGFVALNGCRESRTFDGKEIMKMLAYSEQEVAGLNATAKVTFMYERLEKASDKAAAFVYMHKSLFKIPDYCLEVAAKGRMLSAITDKIAENFDN